MWIVPLSIIAVVAWQMFGLVAFALSDRDGTILEWFSDDPIKPWGQIFILTIWPIVIVAGLIVSHRRRRN